MKQFTPDMAIQNARLELITMFPFFGSVFLRLNIIEDNTCTTAWVDGVTLGYNVDYLGTLPHKQIVGVFVHEVLHVISKHHLRAAGNPEMRLNHKVANWAMDYAINPVIKRTAGMELNPNWLYEQKWDDALFEDIFEQLKRDMPQQKTCGLAGDGPGECRPFPGKDEQGNPKPTGSGTPTQAEIDIAANEVDQWVRAAEFKAQGVGKMTGSCKRVVKKATASEVKWEDELQFLAESITKDDYTWTKPCTSYTHMGIYLPSMTGTQNAVDMVFFVDTSGSLGQSQLNQIMGECRTILDTFNIRVVVIYWDTAYRHIEVFEPEDVLDPSWRLDAKGGGGTNFDGVWDWMDENLPDQDIDPEAIVFFSDLECSNYPDREPDLPLIWAQVPDGCNSFEGSYLTYLPEYGTHVRVPIYRGG